MILRSPAERSSRIALAFLGLVLLGVGGYGLARGWGAFGDQPAHRPSLTDSVGTFVHRNDAIFWTAAVMVAAVLALVGYRWLRAQLPTTGRSHVIDLGETDPARAATAGLVVRGRSELRAHGVAAALADDVARYPGVAAAAALIEPGPPLTVEIRVDLRDGAPVEPVRQRLAEHGLPRLRQALEGDALDARLHVRLADVSRRHLN